MISWPYWQNRRNQPKFDSCIVNSISFNGSTLYVTIQKQILIHQRYPRCNEDIFSTYFNSNNFYILTYIKFEHCQYVNLEKIYSPKIEKLQIIDTYVNCLNQFVSLNYQSLKQVIIKIRDMDIQQLSQLSYCHLISSINFSEKKIKNIQIFSKGKYSNLIELDLSGNQIKKIPQIDAQNLEQLCLDSNQIGSIQNLALRKYKKLQRIYLSFNSLTLLPSINAPMLRQLDVSQNKINSFDDFCSEKLIKCQQFERFRCSKNFIVNIPSFLPFSNSCHLKQLNVRNCGIQNIQILSQFQLKKLQWINLSQNQIVSFQVFQKLILPSIQSMKMFSNLSYVRNSMVKCWIGNNQQKDIKQILIQQETKDEYYNLNWILKNFRKGIQINLETQYGSNSIYDKKKKKLTQVFGRKKVKLGSLLSF